MYTSGMNANQNLERAVSAQLAMRSRRGEIDYEQLDLKDLK